MSSYRVSRWLCAIGGVWGLVYQEDAVCWAAGVGVVLFSLAIRAELDAQQAGLR